MASSILVGISLKPIYYQQVLTEQPAIDWLEVHSENYFMQGGPAIENLASIREIYPISLHGVGLSLGSYEGVSIDHLKRLRRLIHLINPMLVSEHLSWNRNNNIFLPDLLPLPYTSESLKIVCQNVNTTQEFLQREILIENPSTYLEYSVSTYSEPEFLVELARQTGAKILLDINNIYVSSKNNNYDPYEYLNVIPKELVKEIHVAGHSTKKFESGEILHIDTHDNFVSEDVWNLYKTASERFLNCPTLLEWDENLPSLNILLKEASKISFVNSLRKAIRA